MIKKKIRTLIIIGCSIILSVGCGGKASSELQRTNDVDSDGSVLKNIEKENVIDTSWKALDWSEKLSDISIVDKQEITEARIYGYDENVYNTTDREIIDELVKRIKELDLEVIEYDESEPLVCGYEELFLLNGNKVVYHFLYTNYLHVGDNTYGPKENLVYFSMNVMDYCRETFWKQPNAIEDDENSIDISEINEEDIEFISIDADMNVYNPSIEEVSKEADVIFKGKLVGIDSSLDGCNMETNYTFEVDKYYKGDENNSTFTINAFGGIMNMEDYLEQIYSQADMQKRYISDEEEFLYHAEGLEGMKPLDLNSEYFVYAYYYNDSYHPMYTIYGTYKKNDNGEYERHGIYEEDRHTKTLEELENSVKE